MKAPLQTAALFVVAALALGGCSRGPAPSTPPPPGGGQAAGGEGASPARAGGGAGPRPYGQVVTGRAVTQEGMFRVHRMGDSLYFEIPPSELEREMLLIGRPVESTLQDPGGFFGGGARVIVQWERMGDRVILRARNHNLVADSTDAIWRQVSGFRNGPVLASFPVRAVAPDSSVVIDVSDLFLSNIPELSPVESINRSRSWVDRTWSFPRNVNVEVVQSGQARSSAGGGGGGPGAAAGQPPMRSQTVRVHFSMLRLPDDPMMPRWHDERVGFNSSRSYDLSRSEHRAQQVRFIHRFRLEKQNPNAAVSDPVEPIIYWIDPATPDWLKPWIVEGVDKWQPAFEAAGFSNAIFGRVAPTPEEDPDFSLFDARHSVIYWRPSTVANATGGQVVDPRTGEILKGEVNMYHNIMELQKNWYFTQVGPLDERAQSLPLPDSLMGRLVEYVVTHEVGHSIGFPHNMKASAMYPVDSIRSREFLERMNGHVSTLMDYSRFNYVAQPEDSIPPHLLLPQVGPYDVFAVKWGYTPIPGARTPDDEKPTLDAWTRQQDEFPWLRFSTAGASADPENLTEAVGDADAVRATTLGMRNLNRVVDMLLDVAEVPGESYSELNTLYGQAVGQWGRYMGHVTAVVGGAYTQETYGRGPRFTPVERTRQQEAVRYLNTNAFQVPEMFLARDILRRIEQDGVVERFRTQQSRVLGTLLSQARLERLVEFEAMAERSADAYTLADLMRDLRQGIWSELSAGSVRVNVYRRNVQRAFLDTVDRRLHPTQAELTRANNPAPAPWASDVRGVMRAELQDLDRLAQQALGRAADDMTRIHLRDVRTEIGRILSETSGG
jgi:hypothetical protein